MIKKREKSVLKNLNLKNTLFSLFYNGLMEIYFTPDFIEPANKKRGLSLFLSDYKLSNDKYTNKN